MIQFGTNPIAWANDDDQTIGADIATTRILDEAGRQSALTASKTATAGRTSPRRCARFWPNMD